MTELLKKALKSILFYVERKKPQTLNEAKHMLAVVELIASETLADVEKGEKPNAHVPQLRG